MPMWLPLWRTEKEKAKSLLLHFALSNGLSIPSHRYQCQINVRMAKASPAREAKEEKALDASCGFCLAQHGDLLAVHDRGPSVVASSMARGTRIVSPRVGKPPYDFHVQPPCHDRQGVAKRRQEVIHLGNIDNGAALSARACSCRRKTRVVPMRISHAE